MFQDQTKKGKLLDRSGIISQNMPIELANDESQPCQEKNTIYAAKTLYSFVGSSFNLASQPRRF